MFILGQISSKKLYKWRERLRRQLLKNYKKQGKLREQEYFLEKEGKQISRTIDAIDEMIGKE
jgi:hypothetical protein